MNPKWRLEWRVLYCTLFTNLSSFMLGYSFGFPSPIAREVKSGNLLDDYQFGIFSGMFYLSAAIGGFVTIPLMYCMSRKSVIIIAAIISTVGWIVLGSSISIRRVYISKLRDKHHNLLYSPMSHSQT